MSEMTQVAVNARVIRDAAARLEAKGYQGDAVAFTEALIVEAIASGYRRIDPTPALRPDSIADPNGPGRTEFKEAVAGLANRKKDSR
jgi:hypothetical protein